MPILGIIASQLSLGNPSWESIESFTVGSGGSSSITFGSGGTIPQTYKHLQIRAIARGTAATSEIQIKTTFNGASTNYWANHQLFGSGSGTPVGDSDGSTSFIYTGYTTAATATASVFGTTIFDVLDYTNTSKNKTVKTTTGFDTNGGGYIFQRSGLWINTAAITSLTLTPSTGNFAEYSHFALYGVKG